MTVDAELGVVGKVRTELQKERSEVLVWRDNLDGKSVGIDGR
jgi:hypothetical protein